MAADVLRPANDWLWLAAALEGLCAVSVILQEQLEKGQVSQILLVNRDLKDIICNK